MQKEQLQFTRSHEWIEPSGAKRKVGISDFAQSQLGDIVYVEFPDGEKSVKAGDEVCVIESCKATASVYAPVSGKVVNCNRPLIDAPETINVNPYDGGWLFEIEVDPAGPAADLLDYAAYEATCDADH